MESVSGIVVVGTEGFLYQESSPDIGDIISHLWFVGERGE